jgi:hypothetical protein
MSERGIGICSEGFIHDDCIAAARLIEADTLLCPCGW